MSDDDAMSFMQLVNSIPPDLPITRGLVDRLKKADESSPDGVDIVAVMGLLLVAVKELEQSIQTARRGY